MSRILVVDDEARIADFLSQALSAEGFTVDTAFDGSRALELAGTGEYDLVVLDLRLPAVDGVSVLRRLVEARPEQPVLILSALSDPRAKVRCMELGAADYVSKPFDLPELVTRIRARLRQRTAGPVSRYLKAGRVTLDLRRLTADAGQGTVSLSPREFRLLEHLMYRKGRVCTREELLAGVWGYSFDPRTNVVDVYVRRLRSKLGGDIIETVRHVGYCFDGA